MKLFKKVSAILLITIMACMPTMAHQGRTDGSGGHSDNKNKSGLGSYHYHCGGHEAHLHQGGVCPYSSNSTQVTQTNTSNSTKTTNSTNATNTTKTTSSTPTYNEKAINVTLNSQATSITGIAVAGTNLVELKTLCNKLGIAYTYDNTTKTITGTKGDNNFTLTIGSKNATFNGASKTMDVAPITYNGRTYIPVRYVAECVGKTVGYDSNTDTVIIG